MPKPIHLIHHRLQDACVLELLVLPVEFERRLCVFDAVVRLELDVLFQDTPSQEGERETSSSQLDVEEVDGVDDLRFWHLDISDSKILLEAMTQERAAEINQDPELLVCDLQGNEIVL